MQCIGGHAFSASHSTTCLDLGRHDAANIDSCASFSALTLQVVGRQEGRQNMTTRTDKAVIRASRLPARGAEKIPATSFEPRTNTVIAREG